MVNPGGCDTVCYYVDVMMQAGRQAAHAAVSALPKQWHLIWLAPQITTVDHPSLCRPSALPLLSLHLMHLSARTQCSQVALHTCPPPKKTHPVYTVLSAPTCRKQAPFTNPGGFFCFCFEVCCSTYDMVGCIILSVTIIITQPSVYSKGTDPPLSCTCGSEVSLESSE